MTIRIEVRKIEKTFGEGKWEIRIGDIGGSISYHNINKTELIQAFIDELEKEEEKEEKLGVEVKE